MTLIAYIDLAKLVDDANFPAGTSQATGIAIIAAESGRDPNAKHVNADGSIDRGLWQINSVFHSEVTDTCAYDPVCSTAAAFKISNGGTDYTPWSTFNNGAYQIHMEAAKVALDGWSRIKTLNKAMIGLNSQINTLQGQVSNLQTQNSTIQGQLSAANSALASAQQQNASLQADLDQAKADLASAQASLAAEVDLVNKLQAAIQSAQSTLSAALS